MPFHSTVVGGLLCIVFSEIELLSIHVFCWDMWLEEELNGVRVLQGDHFTTVALKFIQPDLLIPYFHIDRRRQEGGGRL